jgi:hypothetical protein
MLVLTGLGVWHLRRVLPSEEVFDGRHLHTAKAVA